MFDYIDKKIKGSQQLEILKNHVDAFDLENFFTSDHYKKIADDIEIFKTKFTSNEYPVDGQDPSIVTFENIRKQDSFYENLWQHVNNDNFKKILLDKFNYDNKILQNTKINITFHTEYPHQIDNAHSDQKDSLSTITLQIYLPTDDSLSDYGTCFVKDGKEIHKTNFLPNGGYMMVSNNNSWHKPMLGVERNSLLIRLTINLGYEKTKTIYNYDSSDTLCHVIWNKDMLMKKQTDWMMIMTLQNLLEHNFKNVAVTTHPFKNKLQFLKELKQKGFKKALIFFGGYVWHNADIIKHIKQLQTENVISGWSNNGKELARQCFMINLDKIDQIEESFAKDKFFSECIDKYTDIGDQVRNNRSYYHPEIPEKDITTGWISNSYQIQDKQLYEKVKYFEPYKNNHKTLKKLLESILS
tara:strand:- start:1026 stop:2261 length:1236 start_codon:yes stop_codon:yes gene_type:complete